MDDSQRLTVFEGDGIAFSGPADEADRWVRAALRTDPSRIFLALDEADGRVVDIDLREEAAQPPRGRGRPKLGVSAREVTLLPRHWDWLAAQPGGASVTLRRLVEEARRSDAQAAHVAREAAYRAMTTLAGDRPGYEEAVRALYAGEAERFRELTGAWPPDIRDFVQRVAAVG